MNSRIKWQHLIVGTGIVLLLLWAGLAEFGII